jgi:hypothetical protein
MKTRTLCLAILLLGAAGVASADQDESHWGGGKSHDRVNDQQGAGKSHDSFHDRSAPTLQAPEIDPVSMVAALTLLGGILAVSRGHRTDRRSP